MWKRGMHMVVWWESQKEIGHEKDLAVGGRIILRLILKRQDGCC
jgi:hypothetical protein